ncbi:hypothetical protein BN1184_BN_00120 [Pantoea ananatis]|nr:hypothetical protein BN1184_BN_00120 [Pantoea ananatis]
MIFLMREKAVEAFHKTAGLIVKKSVFFTISFVCIRVERLTLKSLVWPVIWISDAF